MVRTHEKTSQLTFACHVHRLLFASVSSLAVFSHYRAMTTDPGAVPPDAHPLPSPETEEEMGTSFFPITRIATATTAMEEGLPRSPGRRGGDPMDELDDLIKGERTTTTTTTTTTTANSMAMMLRDDNHRDGGGGGDHHRGGTARAAAGSVAAAAIAGTAAATVAAAGAAVGAIRTTTAAGKALGAVAVTAKLEELDAESARSGAILLSTTILLYYYTIRLYYYTLERRQAAPWRRSPLGCKSSR